MIWKKIKKLIYDYWIIVCSILLFSLNLSIIFFADQKVTGIISTLNVSVGWIISIYLQNRNFQKGEIAKNKDKLTSLIEIFFKELSELIAKRDTTADDIDDFISDKITIIELKAHQLKSIFNEDIQFISDATLSSLRDKPIDIFELNYKECKKELKKLSSSVLNEIETTYADWLKM